MYGVYLLQPLAAVPGSGGDVDSCAAKVRRVSRLVRRIRAMEKELGIGDGDGHGNRDRVTVNGDGDGDGDEYDHMAALALTSAV
jgi:hypothetical protein